LLPYNFANIAECGTPGLNEKTDHFGEYVVFQGCGAVTDTLNVQQDAIILMGSVLCEVTPGYAYMGFIPRLNESNAKDGAVTDKLVE